MVGTTDNAAAPSRIEGASAPAGLDPMERFVLDQIDGRTSVAALADATMLEPTQVEAVLRKLVERGLVRHGVAPASPPPAAGPLGNDATDALRRFRIETVHSHLKTATHYEMLGVEPAADKALVKRAYFVLSKEFHPDATGRKLASHKAMLEAIFRQITEAHDVLTRPKRREAYDAELASSRKPPFTVQLHPPVELPAGERKEERPAVVVSPPPTAVAAPASPPPAAPLPAGATPPGTVRSTVRMATAAGSESLGPRVRPGDSSPGAARPQGADPRPPLAGAPTSPGAQTSVAPPRPAVDPATAAAHAQRLARDLARQTGYSEEIRLRTSDEVRRRASDEVRVRASDELRMRTSEELRAPSQVAADNQRSLMRALHSASQMTGPVDRASQYERQAAAAEASGDLAGAVQALRLALQFDAERRDLRVRFEQLDRRLAASEADAQREKAKQFERAGAHDRAAMAWARVCLGRPTDFEAQISAARALLAAGADLRQARDFAQKSVDLEPARVDARILLAQVFAAAGMRLNAQREAEAAAKLDPANELVKNLQRELK